MGSKYKSTYYFLKNNDKKLIIRLFQIVLFRFYVNCLRIKNPFFSLSLFQVKEVGHAICHLTQSLWSLLHRRKSADPLTFKGIQPHLAREKMEFCGNKLGTDKVKRKQLSIDIQLLSCFICTQSRTS